LTIEHIPDRPIDALRRGEVPRAPVPRPHPGIGRDVPLLSQAARRPRLELSHRLLRRASARDNQVHTVCANAERMERPPSELGMTLDDLVDHGAGLRAEDDPFVLQFGRLEPYEAGSWFQARGGRSALGPI